MSISNATVFIIDDDADFRDSVQWLLESTSYTIESYASAQQFLDQYDQRPGCMLLDVRMPDINGLALQQIMQERDIRLPVIILTGHGDVPMAVAAMKNGALDFLEKPFDDDVLLTLVDRAMADAETRFSQQSEERELRELYDSLSRREREVMDLVVTGNSNREIAETLGISPKTVEVHRSRVMSKMRAESLAHLVQMHSRLAL
ncbi:MAG: response regulator transcription factor [Oceanospirillales bacterium]|uniref:LuxR family two component transcriptional regulator n=1 Tax=Marinobacterium halophilum TaxID=267374 RepID=A0A2P8EVE0_9GAMM|nr:sigma-70 family RNA polymerase sigma factor [Marinobacterium halophilum]MBR9828830.1 response regulator transcription factor [Oceanospirillales bacterium]PSL13437.1 LuxR family two component transcriptional regulator [Marinobacterium halophilum]